MSEVLSFHANDARKYGEEAATVLYVIRFNMKMHKASQPEDWVDFDGVKHLEFSDTYFQSCLEYKPMINIKRILKRLHKLNVISIKEGSYYVTVD